MTKEIIWKIANHLPQISDTQKQLGLAGMVGGYNNGVILMAGGSNFLNSMPWNGGKKKYWNNIYLLDIKNNICKLLQDTLNEPIAYGASVTTLKGIIYLGGENDNGISKNVFQLQWDKLNQHTLIKFLPALPIALTNLSATAIDNTIYVVGGETATNAVASVFTLSLDDANPVWQTLPALPIALSHAAVVAQSNGKETCIYVIGGRTKTPSGISDLHGTVFCYHPSIKSWQTLSPLSNEIGSVNLSAATAVAIGENEIIIMGGDDGKIFTRLETLNAKIESNLNKDEIEKLKKTKLEIINHHSGFNKSVRLFNTVSNKWKLLSPLPYSPVTTFSIQFNNKIFIPGGEIKPGIRTGNILMGTIKSKK